MKSKLLKALVTMEVRVKEFVKREEGEFGIGWVIGVAIVLIISAFVLVPGLRGFAEDIMEKVEGWYSNTIEAKIFNAS
ncbi:hypothetical protein EDC18_101327 [Natranaerovirga pectinivora]|uniref:Uncharacterized protein n=1 Tax=Natranaerovirga pectinivora TaxID=682400 RepID=A0A4R3MP79_9FIRM|nr:hypothetical protein [Natranaerovirga pectinivora]TCT17031.1 hypothetical protein EDC18_101327 [Natranaerovirga pectinivora]